MPAEVHYFGIRHHGPGSARALLQALNDLRPSHVLIEGPADCSDLLPLLADKAMVPPVALLAYAEDDPGSASFWPFAQYSPEYRAVLWGVENNAALEFIDLPVSWRLPQKEAESIEEAEELDDAAAGSEEVAETDPLVRDPIGALALAAGYEDGESWWRDIIEENPDPGPIFAAVADAMGALRADAVPPDGLEAAREAHMRLAIAKAAKEADGRIAVVCGAWHVPALQAKHALKDDRALLKGTPGAISRKVGAGDTSGNATKPKKRRIAATWAPWTSPRLARRSGYGAGVAAPNWCAHIWETPGSEASIRWIGRIARTLREDGHIVSTASLIETERLATTLAAMRERPAPGFDDIREAAIATLCTGNHALWLSISERLLIGNEVGAIPVDVPRVPLLEDLQRQQKKARLKPEALQREISLDLRTEGGLFRSTLLHRLGVLGVGWGRLADAGKSRGTFRERWVVAWEPEFAVALVENIVHGPTIERAATGRMAALLNETRTLGDLARLVRDAMTSQLPEAAHHGIERLGTRAAQTSDCNELLTALPPMADLIRYGEARSGDMDQMAALMRRIAVQGALALPYAARGLDAEASAALTTAMRAADAAIRLAELPEDDIDGWEDALEALLTDTQAARLVAGAAAQLLFAAEGLEPEEAQDLLARMLSPAVPVADAAGFFEGFFDGACTRLIYDEGLRGAVDGWMAGLDEEAFNDFLPLFRRVFSALDKSERTRLLGALFGRDSRGPAGLVALENAEAHWQRHLDTLMNILEGRGRDG